MASSNAGRAVLDLSMWITNIDSNDFTEALEALELRQDEGERACFQRLMRCLAGNYTAGDFLPNAEYEDENELHAHRVTLRNEYIEGLGRDLGIPVDGNLSRSLGFSTNGEIEEQRNNESMTNPLANSTGAGNETHSPSRSIQTTVTTTTITTTGTSSPTPNSGTHGGDIRNTYSYERPVTSAGHKEGYFDPIMVQLPDGSQQLAPRNIAAMLYEAQLKLWRLEKENQSPARNTNFASSTRLTASTATVPPVPGTPGPNLVPPPMDLTGIPPQWKTAPADNLTQGQQRNVAFDSTYDLRYYDHNAPVHPPVHSGTANQPDRGSNSVSNQRESFDTQRNEQRRLDSRTPSTPNTGTMNRSSYTTRSFSSTFDVGRTLRSWQLKFSGKRGYSVEEFLQRIEECNRLYNVPEPDLLNGMSEMLTEVALQWYRQFKDSITTWAQFCEAARAQFGVDRRFQSRIIREAERRTQGKYEPSHEFIFKLNTILNRLEEPWPEHRKVQLIFDNLQPAIRRYVPFDKATTIQNLIKLAAEAEMLVDEENSFREPPPSNKSLFYDTAYTPPATGTPEKTKWQIAAVTAPKISQSQINQQKEDALTAKIAKMEKEWQEILTKLTARAGAENSSEKHTTKPTEKRDEPKERPRAEPSEEKKVHGKKYTPKKPRAPKIENADKDPGPLPKYTCYGCGWPGWMKSACPACSGKEQGAA